VFDAIPLVAGKDFISVSAVVSSFLCLDLVRVVPSPLLGARALAFLAMPEEPVSGLRVAIELVR
jgi:hypothetical protein